MPCACACASPSRIWAPASTAIASVSRRRASPRAACARHVLVGDVDVPLVAREGVGPQAARMAQAGGRLGLALRARAGLALARDDLQGDLEPVRLVAREPDRARAAAPERAQRPVAAEDESGAQQRARAVFDTQDRGWPSAARTPFRPIGLQMPIEWRPLVSTTAATTSSSTSSTSLRHGRIRGARGSSGSRAAAARRAPRASARTASRRSCASSA